MPRLILALLIRRPERRLKLLACAADANAEMGRATLAAQNDLP